MPLVPGKSFFVPNLYSMGLSALLAKGLATQATGGRGDGQSGEFYIPDRSGKALPLGAFRRFHRNRFGT